MNYESLFVNDLFSGINHISVVEGKSPRATNSMKKSNNSPIYVGHCGVKTVEVLISDGYMPDDAVPYGGGELREVEAGEWVIVSHDPANETSDDLIVIGRVSRRTAVERCRKWIRQKGGVIHRAT